MIINHMPQAIDVLGSALGQYSEQEIESAHSAFDLVLRRYKVKNKNTEAYMYNYCKAIMVFNADHI